MEVVIDLLNKRARGLQKTGAPKRKNQAGSSSIPVAVGSSLSSIWNTDHSDMKLVSAGFADCLDKGSVYMVSEDILA